MRYNIPVVPSMLRPVPAVALALLILGCRQDEIQVYRIAKSAAAPEAGGQGAAALAGAGRLPLAGEGALPEGHPPFAEPPAAGAVDAALAASAAGGGAELRWQAPAGWQYTPGTGMRKATFRVGAAEMSVIALAGGAGGELSNVNRWRGQLGLKELPEGGLAGAAEKVRSAAGPALAVDFLGADGRSRLLGAMIPYDGQTWFFKLTGPDAEVRAAKPAFTAFLKSLRGGA